MTFSFFLFFLYVTDDIFECYATCPVSPILPSGVVFRNVYVLSQNKRAW